MNTESKYQMMATLLAQKNIHDVDRVDVLAALRVVRLIHDVVNAGSQADQQMEAIRRSNAFS